MRVYVHPKRANAPYRLAQPPAAQASYHFPLIHVHTCKLTALLHLLLVIKMLPPWLPARNAGSSADTTYRHNTIKQSRLLLGPPSHSSAPTKTISHQYTHNKACMAQARLSPITHSNIIISPLADTPSSRLLRRGLLVAGRETAAGCRLLLHHTGGCDRAHAARLALGLLLGRRHHGKAHAAADRDAGACAETRDRKLTTGPHARSA